MDNKPDENIYTTYMIFNPDGSQEQRMVEWPQEPGFDRINALVSPLVDGNIEHVTVLAGDQYLDMFVHDEGALIPLAINDKATAIYRHNMLSHNPHMKAESLPPIYGVAVLFHRKVWF